jgi:hypothetical protein
MRLGDAFVNNMTTFEGSRSKNRLFVNALLSEAYLNLEKKTRFN